MTIVRGKKTNKKNVRFCLLAASLIIMYGYWYGTKTENEEDNSNSLALSQSFGFFDTVSNKEWKLLQKITAEHNNHRFPELPLTYNPVFTSKSRDVASNPAWWQNVRGS